MLGIETNAAPLPDRRKQIRFPMVLRLQYRLGGGPCQEGHLVNLSSGGAFFRAAEPVRVGARVELSVPWPYLLDGNCRLQLRIRGTVVRSDSFGVAVQSSRHEFRTASKGKASLKAAAMALRSSA